MIRNRQVFAAATPAFRCILLSSMLTCLSLGAIAHAQDYASGQPGKAGRVMLNLRAGPTLGVTTSSRDLRCLGAVGIDLGIAVSPGYSAYLVLTPQVALRPNFYNVMVPLGFQYDLRLVSGLYLYPRLSIGYSAMINTSAENPGPLVGTPTVIHGGVGIPEVGIKYVVGRRLNVGFEPVSVPIFFTTTSYSVWYRVMLFLGSNL